MFGFLSRVKTLKDKIDIAIKDSRIALENYQQEIVIQKKEYMYWPLFLCDNEDSACSFDIDCCSLSIGISLSVGMKNIPPKKLCELANSTELLLSMRNDNCSWPSVIQKQENSQVEGVINDTIVALHALLDIQFLEDPPLVKIEKDGLSDRCARVTYFKESLQWLLDNRIGDGWHYTSIEYIKSPHPSLVAMQPTSAALTLIHRAHIAFFAIDENFSNTLVAVYRKGCKMLCDLKGEANGVGKNKADKTRLIHTCLAFNVLSMDRNDFETCKKSFFAHILRESSPKKLKELTVDDCFDSYKQNIFFEDNTFSYRTIFHETALEATILSSYTEAISMYFNSNINFIDKYKMSRNFRHLIVALLARQERGGSFRGSFKSNRMMEGEQYPIYSIMHSTLALKKADELIECASTKYFFLANVIAATGLLALLLGTYYVFTASIDKVGVVSSITATVIVSGISIIFQAIRSR